MINIPDERPRDERILDMQFCYFAFGFKPSDYIGYKLYLDEVDCTQYISEVERIYYSYLMSDTTEMQVYMDKRKTYSKVSSRYGREAIYVAQCGLYHA